MKILELCTYSAGGCGVWSRVKKESSLLKKRGHEVYVFSSNFEKGSDNIVPEIDEFEGVKIKRFSAKKLGGESFMNWNFEEDAIKYNPDVIIAHSYRHTHTLKALKISKKIKCKVFLVTHAPFDREGNRTIIQNIAVKIYDILFKKNLNKFDKVITITKWETPYLKKLGLNEEKISYIPNGISKEFFNNGKATINKNTIIYTGRVSPIKNIEVVIKALSFNKNKEIFFEIFGPFEKNYKERITDLIKIKKLQKNIKITDKLFNSKEQISKLDKSFIYILPSYSEGMPQSLIEAMARRKIVIASNIKSSKDLIKDKKNGFLFENNDDKSLIGTINKIYSMPKKEIENIQDDAKKSVLDFSWEKIIKKLEKEIIN